LQDKPLPPEPLPPLITGLLNCISLNVRGINNPIKRKKVLTFFKKQNTDIAFIQETHLTDVEHLKLRRDWVGQVFYSSFSSKSRGVALLINKNLRFRLNYMEKDRAGRLILIDCVINTNRIILVSLYGPNLDNSEFFKDLILKLAAVEAPCILGGTTTVSSVRDFSSAVRQTKKILPAHSHQHL
uniref:exodeoxyribonuclease III n=1 Tax=Kryptolebias marmoratus TaxID=37003 RepID=A0A3Q3B087_KRYMA